MARKTGLFSFQNSQSGLWEAARGIWQASGMLLSNAYCAREMLEGGVDGVSVAVGVFPS